LQSLAFEGGRKLKIPTPGLKLHVKSETHNSATMRWTEFMWMVDGSTSAHQIVSESHAENVHEHRHCVKTVREVLALTATQHVWSQGSEHWWKCHCRKFYANLVTA